MKFILICIVLEKAETKIFSFPYQLRFSIHWLDKLLYSDMLIVFNAYYSHLVWYIYLVSEEDRKSLKIENKVTKIL